MGTAAKAGLRPAELHALHTGSIDWQGPLPPCAQVGALREEDEKFKRLVDLNGGAGLGSGKNHVWHRVDIIEKREAEVVGFWWAV